MCGFVGSLGGDGYVNLSSIDEMMGSLEHRGPDSDGKWHDLKSCFVVGHKRLSILDTSKNGNQPMISCSGRYVLAFNGEIYNHLDLRKQLNELLSVNWNSSSDTESLLFGFEQWGIKKTLQKTRGMFAISVWDRKRSILTLARDRVGEKPLYYGWQNKLEDSTLLFGSELKALKKHPTFLSKISKKALVQYVNNKSVKGEQTIYEGIYKVKPGTLINISLNKDIETETYWSMEDVINEAKNNQFKGSEEEAIKSLDNILDKAVTEQMISDVPLGSFLSGGVDSSVIAAFMQKNSTKPVKTFAIGFEDKRFNEAGYAKEVANHLGTDHCELYVTSQQALDVIPKLANIYDEPFSDSSQIPTILVSELAKQHVKVSLSGDAGDEIFCGYNRYLDSEKYWNFISFLPESSRNSLYKYLKNNDSKLLNNSVNLIPSNNVRNKLIKGFELMPSKSRMDLYKRFKSHHWYDSDSIVLGAEYNDESKKYFDISNSNFQEQMMVDDLMYYLVDDILTKVDRASLSVSLESRIPFLDPRVIEHAWQIPFNMKAKKIGKNYDQKYILKKVLFQYVPKNLIDRPKKGFAVPMSDWLRGPLKDWAENLLDERKLKEDGLLNHKLIRKKWKEHSEYSRNWQSELWGILMFQEWLENEKNT